jgi:hypothetical protein
MTEAAVPWVDGVGLMVNVGPVRLVSGYEEPQVWLVRSTTA